MKFSTIVGGIFDFLWKTALVVIAVYYALSFCNVSFYNIKKIFDSNGKLYESLNERIDLYGFNYGTYYRLYDHDRDKFISKKYKKIGSVEYGDSLAVFTNDNERYGYLNINTGKIVVPNNLKFATDFYNGIAAIVPETETQVHFVNSEFEDIFDETFFFYEDDIADSGLYRFNENGYCIVPAEEGSLYGVFNSTGDWILEPIYSDITECRQVPYYIIKNSANKYGVVDTCFNWTIEPTYDYIQQTYDCSALYATKSSVQRMIDYHGNIINPFVVGDTGDLTYDITTKNDAGEYTTSSIVSDKVCYFTTGHREIKETYGLMDKHTGRVIIPARYSSIGLVSENIVKCGIDYYSYRLYDITGKPIN